MQSIGRRRHARGSAEVRQDRLHACGPIAQTSQKNGSVKRE
jgi:hypothetical protein